MRKKIVLLCCMLLMLCSCGKREQTVDKPDNNVKTEGRDLKELEKKMLEADSTLPEMVVVHGSDKDAAQNFTGLSDIDYDRVDDYFYAYSKKGGAEEVAVIRMKSKEDISPMMDSIHAHLKDRKGTMEEYEPDKVGMIDKAVVTYEENEVAMIISDRSGLVQEQFKSKKSE